MLTDKQKEAAARELCKFRGVDPDSIVFGDPIISTGGFSTGEMTSIIAWKSVIPEIESFIVIQNVINNSLSIKE